MTPVQDWQTPRIDKLESWLREARTNINELLVRLGDLGDEVAILKSRMPQCTDNETGVMYQFHSFTTIKSGSLEGNYVCERCGCGKGE